MIKYKQPEDFHDEVFKDVIKNLRLNRSFQYKGKNFLLVYNNKYTFTPEGKLVLLTSNGPEIFASPDPSIWSI